MASRTASTSVVGSDEHAKEKHNSFRQQQQQKKTWLQAATGPPSHHGWHGTWTCTSPTCGYNGNWQSHRYCHWCHKPRKSKAGNKQKPLEACTVDELRRALATKEGSKAEGEDDNSEDDSQESLRKRLKSLKESKKHAEDSDVVELCDRKIAELEKAIKDSIPDGKQQFHIAQQLNQKRNALAKRKVQLEKAQAAVDAAVTTANEHSKKIAELESEVVVLGEELRRAAGAPVVPGAPTCIEAFHITPEMQALDPNLAARVQEISQQLESVRARATVQQDKGPEASMDQTDPAPPAPQPAQEIPTEAVDSQAQQEPKAPPQDAFDEDADMEHYTDVYYDSLLRTETKPEDATQEQFQEAIKVMAVKHATTHLEASKEKRRRQCL